MNSTMIHLSVTQVFIPMPIKIGGNFSKSPRPTVYTANIAKPEKKANLSPASLGLC